MDHTEIMTFKVFISANQTNSKSHVNLKKYMKTIYK